MTLNNFTRRVANKTNISIKDMREILTAVGEEIVAVVNEDGEVTPFTGFKFEKIYRPSRPGTNPQTGEKIEIPGMYLMHVKFGKVVKTAMND